MHNAREFGAVGDGTALDHAAIQRAIDSCAASGGGMVLVPPGVYRCGTIRLRSGTDLHLEAGAAIVASKNQTDFPRLGDSPDPKLANLQAMIVADKASDVSISGPGRVDGEAVCSSPDANPGARFRPAMVYLRDCRNVKVTDVTLLHPDFWTLHLHRCEDVMVRGITIRADKCRINTDGIDPDGCKNVVISDCNITTGDDCIVLKSTDGTPCENIVINNCILSSGEAAFKLGTEALGPIRNVQLNNCIIRDSGYGCALYMKDGSVYESISLSNVIMETTRDFSVIIDISPRHFGVGRPGCIRNVRFSNVIARGPGRCYVEGTPESLVRNVTLDNVTWEIDGPCNFAQATKPRGTIRFTPGPDEVNYAVHPFQCTAVNVEGLWVRNARFAKSNGATPDRGMYYLNSIRNGNVETGVAHAVPSELPRVVVENCLNLHMTGESASALSR